MEQVVPNEFQQPVQGPDPEITQILQEAGRPNMIERPILVLHSPQLIGQQVLRPIVYNFNDEVKNRVYDGSIKHGNGAYFLSPRDGSEDVLRASMVATDGILLDTTPIEQNWTFMFIMKGHNAAMQYVPGSNVTVAIGYVYSENGDVPVSPYGAINDNAILVFTHCLVGNSTADYGAAGGQVRLMAFGADATGCAISRTCGNPLYAATPKDMLQIGLGIGFDGSPSTPEVMAMKEQTYCLSNPTNGDLVGYKIGSNLRSPQEHLYSLTRAIGSGTSVSRGTPITTTPELGMPASIPTQLGVFHDNVMDNICASNYMPSLGFNFNEPHTIGEIKMTFQAIVQVCQLTDHPQFDVTMQSMVHPRITGSAFITSSVSAYLVKHGILEISFVWKGYTPDPFGIGNPNDQDFVCLTIGTALESDELSRRKIIAEFATYWRLYVVPMLTYLGNGSPCFCTATISTVNQTTVDLQFYDDPSTMHDGWYTTSPNLAALFNPNVYDQKTFRSNAQQMALLTDVVGNRVAMETLPEQQNSVANLQTPFAAPQPQPAYASPWI